MRGKGSEEEAGYLPLFETKVARGGAFHKLFCLTMVVAIVSMWAYRFMHVPAPVEPGRYAWIGMLFAEVLFGLYWIVSQSGRWRVVYRRPFKDRLSARFEDRLPAVDIFVCTADPTLEPPSMVISTVLSVMSYNYPPDKLSVYLSDDGGSELTFYALIEASNFAKYWIPFCRKYNVEPRSPELYFSGSTESDESSFAREWTNVKELYEDMKSRLTSAAVKGVIPEEIRDRNRGFSEWNSVISRHDHQSIVKILIDGWNPEAVDVEGNRLPTLVYVSREKRPGQPHNFKAGAMNALIRVSSEISNAPVILNVDCDMYANDPDAIRNALCFFLDNKHGHRISYVQHPQYFYNIVNNDVYANVSLAINAVEICGLDGHGGAPYAGTGCFHRRESLSGKKYLDSHNHRIECHDVKDITKGRTVEELEIASRALATCSSEKGTLWGKEMGLIYGCPVEDLLTGLSILSRGWKPVCYTPSKHAFKGLAPTTLDISLIQFKRWSGGMFQIFLSKYCPFIYGYGKITFGAQMTYCTYFLWAPVSLPTLCYVVIPALSLVRGLSLFPDTDNLWFLPYVYFFTAKSAYTLAEDVIHGNTVKGWWNMQRMVLFRRTTAFFFGFIDNVARLLGLSETSFVLTAKVVEDEESWKRYVKGIIDFGSASIMLTIIVTVAVLNFFGLGRGILLSEKFVPEIAICGVIVILNLPVYEAVLWRRDSGSIPPVVAFKAVVVASVACLISVY